VKVAYITTVVAITIVEIGIFIENLSKVSKNAATLVQEIEMTAVISNFWLRVRNRGIYGRGKKVVLYASVTNPRHI